MRLLAELGFQLLTRTTHAGASRIAGLRHEAIDDAMKHHAIIKAFAGELLDPRAMTWRQVWPHADLHRASRGVEDQDVFRLAGHNVVLVDGSYGSIVAFLMLFRMGKTLFRLYVHYDSQTLHTAHC